MGLDFSHGGAHWSYGGFHRFRIRLAKEVGIELEEMRGFGGQGCWGDLRHDVIHELLCHSDCDGELSPEECASIAPRLRELVEHWNDDDWNGKDFDQHQAHLLAEGMETCATLGEALRFC